MPLATGVVSLNGGIALGPPPAFETMVCLNVLGLKQSDSDLPLSAYIPLLLASPNARAEVTTDTGPEGIRVRLPIVVPIRKAQYSFVFLSDRDFVEENFNLSLRLDDGSTRLIDEFHTSRTVKSDGL
jgi:hypothetical protein